MLAGLFPGRIDLGIGRAAGTDPMTTLRAPARPPPGRARRLPRSSSPSCSAYLEDRLPARPPVRAARRRCPACPRRPSRGCSAPRRRARSGPPSSACPTRSPTSSTRTGAADRRPLPRALRRRRARSPAPRVAVGVWAICADTDEEAQRLAASARMAFALLRRGRLIPVPPVEKALRFLESEGQALDATPPGRRARGRHAGDRRAPGSSEVAAEYGAEEVIVVTITHDHEARRRSYELIAEAFELAGAPRPPSRSPPSGYRQGVADAPAPAPGVRTRPVSLRPAPALGAARVRRRRPRADRPRRRPRCAPEDALRRARDRRRALAPLPALRQLAARSRRPTGAGARAPARPRRDRAAAARAPAARQDRAAR